MPRPKTQSIASRGPNTWRLTWELGVDAQGKRRQRRATFHGSKAAAGKYWRTVQAELDQQKPPAFPTPSASPTLAQYWEQWLAAMRALPRKPTTLRQYQDIGRLYWLPRCGSWPLDQLTPRALQRVLGELAQAPRQDGKPGTLSPTTVNRCYVILHTALQQAVAWDLLPANPLDKVPTPAKADYRAHVWDAATVQQFLAATEADPLRIAYLLALYAGLRRGEIVGLRWVDVDWDHHTLTITQQRVKVGGTDQFSTPKTAKGQRVIAVGRQLTEALRQQWARQQTQRQLYAAAYQDHGLVCQTKLGTPIGTRNLNRAFARAIAQAGVPAIHLHELRHTHGTELFEAGVDLKTIADRMGHSQISTTAKLYVHPGLDLQTKAAEMLEGRWARDEGQPGE